MIKSMFIIVIIFLIFSFSRSYTAEINKDKKTGNPESAINRNTFIGRVVKILGRDRAWKRTSALLLQEVNSTSDNVMFLGGDEIIQSIEDANKLLFDDYITGDISGKDIKVCLRGFKIIDKTINGNNYKVATEIEEINPAPGSSKDFVRVDKINPPDPKEDFHHRYIDVPICYKHPEWGTFKLYYEINRDFDPEKPTIMCPGSGQVTNSWMGYADIYKKKLFGTSFNTVVFQYRGTYHSRIDKVSVDRELDWSLAYQILNSDNVIEDMDRVRKDLLGQDGKIFLWGGSATAVIGIKYLGRYHDNVSRAFLMSFFNDAASCCRAEVKYFEDFLIERDLQSSYDKIVRENPVFLPQLLYSSYLYLNSDQEKAEKLIRETGNGSLSLYNSETKEHPVDYFIRSAQKNWPGLAVFFYETNITVYEDGRLDINFPSFSIGEPVTKYVPEKERDLKPFAVQSLESVKSEVLLLSGSLDQVTPLEDVEKVHMQLSNSRHIILKGYHCLYDQTAIRNKISELFFKSGLNSKELNDFLNMDDVKKLVEKK